MQSERGTWYVRRVDTLNKNVRFPQLEVKLRVTLLTHRIACLACLLLRSSAAPEYQRLLKRSNRAH